jgi:hypothetical protein
LDISSKLLYITTKFTNTTLLPEFIGDGNSIMYQPLKWIKTSGTHGNGLLQLRPNYEILSLNSLAIQTKRTEIELQETPLGCMKLLNDSKYEQIIRQFMLKYSKQNEEQICNVHIGSDAGYVVFFHECCYINDENETICLRVEKNLWMKTIDVCTYIIIVLAMLYCPMLIPTSFYRQKYTPSSFVHIPQKPVTITVKKTTDTGIWWENRHVLETVSLSKFAGMTNFLQTLGDMKNETTYELKVSKLNLNVRHDQILSENKAPTSLSRTIYDAFFECGIRDKCDTKDCCNTNILGCFRLFGKEYPWFKCLRLFMRIILCLIVCSPWIARLCVYYIYEREIRSERQKAADDRNMKLHLRVNLTYFLTPVHVLFVACYVMIALDYVLFGFVSKKLKLELQTMAQSCLQDMRDGSKMVVIKWAFRVLTIPFRKFGIFGFIIGLIFWIPAVPVVIIVLSFRLFPTVNLSLSLLLSFSSFFTPKTSTCFRNNTSKICKWINNCCDTFDFNTNYKDTGKGRSRGLQYQVRKPYIHNPIWRFIVIMIALLTMTSFVLLTMECIIFLIEVAIYTLIGLILNSSHAMQYISALSIGWLYFNNCFSGVGRLYLKYNKLVHRILQDDNREKLTEVAKLSSDEQENTAFKVEYASIEPASITNSFGTPKWSTKGVVLLLDKFDNPYITKQFFFEACGIVHPNCPGDLSDHIIVSFRRFISIAMFLLFVTLVVLAFGDAYSISISNQLLATVAGGFVPWILMKSDILFSKPEEPDFGQLTSNINFMSSFQATINDDKEMWKIKDIVVQEKKLLFEETGNQQETDNIEQDKPEEEIFASLLTEVTNNDYKRGIDLNIEVPENFIYETPEIV